RSEEATGFGGLLLGVGVQRPTELRVGEVHVDGGARLGDIDRGWGRHHGGQQRADVERGNEVEPDSGAAGLHVRVGEGDDLSLSDGAPEHLSSSSPTAYRVLLPLPRELAVVSRIRRPALVSPLLERGASLFLDAPAADHTDDHHDHDHRNYDVAKYVHWGDVIGGARPRRFRPFRMPTDCTTSPQALIFGSARVTTSVRG